MRWKNYRTENIPWYDVPRHTAELSLASPAGLKENRTKNRQNLRLPNQSHRQDIFMCAQRPTFHIAVKSAALFLFTGALPGVVPRQSKFSVH